MIAVSTMIEKLRRTLKDEDKNSFADAELIDYIESGVAFLRRLIITNNPEYIAVPMAAGGILEAGENEIELEASGYILDVRVNGEKIFAENISSIGDIAAEGKPKSYCLLNGNKMLLFPVPDKDVGYSVIGVPDAPLLSAEAVTPYGSDMDNLIFEYAVIRAGIGDQFQMAQEMEIMSVIAQQVTTILLRYNQSENSVVKGYY